jgi:N-acetylglucosaminyldiphosphoundecaprenol N-acetyl-beta-D-mannosaminyltransferase
MTFRIDKAVIRVDLPDRAATLSTIEGYLRARQGFALATLNLDHLVKLRQNPAFRDAYAAQDHVTADGNPIVWLSRLAGRPVGLVPGSDLLDPVLALAARLDVAVAFVGSTQPVLDRAAEQVQVHHPGLRVVARLAPPMGFDPDSVQALDLLEQVARSGAGLCLLALGAPKQEMLAARGRKVAPQVGFLSIGASLDFVAGHQRRAPELVRKLALEWLWRMLSNPRRLFWRYAQCAAILPGQAAAALELRRPPRG